MDIPFVSADQMQIIDDVAVDNGLEIRQMMELAGERMAEFIRRFYAVDRKILIVCGKGNNGGDGLSCARFLINRGYEVSVYLAEKPEVFKEDPWCHYKMLEKMEAVLKLYRDKAELAEDLKRFDLSIDALLGYNISGDPSSIYAEIIDALNESGRPTVSYDLPSGFDGTAGEARNPCVRASATLCLGLPKVGFKTKGAKAYIGDVYLGDIGIPEFIFNSVAKVGPIFKDDSIIKIEIK